MLDRVGAVLGLFCAYICMYDGFIINNTEDSFYI